MFYYSLKIKNWLFILKSPKRDSFVVNLLAFWITSTLNSLKPLLLTFIVISILLISIDVCRLKSLFLLELVHVLTLWLSCFLGYLNLLVHLIKLKLLEFSEHVCTLEDFACAINEGLLKTLNLPQHFFFWSIWLNITFFIWWIAIFIYILL